MDKQVFEVSTTQGSDTPIRIQIKTRAGVLAVPSDFMSIVYRITKADDPETGVEPTVVDPDTYVLSVAGKVDWKGDSLGYNLDHYIPAEKLSEGVKYRVVYDFVFTDGFKTRAFINVNAAESLVD